MSMAHQHQEPPRTLVIAVIVVSDTRTLATDEGGALIADLAKAAGHKVVSREVVPDDVGAVEDALDRVLIAGSQVVILTGGTGVSPRDVTPDAVLPRLARQIDGFGELFRALSFQQIGAAAMLSRAFAGAIGTAAVFGLPGSAAACRLAMERLILPELSHLSAELSKPGRGGWTEPPAHGPPHPSPAARSDDEPTQIYRMEAKELRGPVSAQPSSARQDPDSTPPEATVIAPNKLRGGMGVGLMEAARSTGTFQADPPLWHQALEALGGTFEPDKRPEAPDDLERVAPAMEVLNRAGQRGAMVLPDGRRFGLWGFPDLRHQGSKILAIREASPVPEILALHRWPFRAGTCVEDRPIVEGADQPPTEVCERLIGRAPPDPSGGVLAIDRGTVWIQRGNRVFKWDGRRESDEGPLRSALGRLILGWSER